MPPSSRSVDDDHAVAQRFAAEHALEHVHSRRDLTHRWESYPFGIGTWRRARNVVRGSLHGRSITAFEYHYVLLSDDTNERDAFRNFLVCVVDLDHAVPPLTAVRKDRLLWHGDRLVGGEIPIAHQAWRDEYSLFGEDDDFAHAVLTHEHAARCAQADIRAEWRFAADDFLLWIESARVSDMLTAALEVLRPLISAAEGFGSRDAQEQ
ncbi:hypothetical protein [Blastococcus litoris]|uniref:hypothetical protein n=1 Tax=Blastococcus litoris TaxID=2171622 RepID=UPI0013E00464|nr:hypothetical protein [Blastococcus litoris]